MIKKEFPLKGIKQVSKCFDNLKRRGKIPEEVLRNISFNVVQKWTENEIDLLSRLVRENTMSR